MSVAYAQRSPQLNDSSPPQKTSLAAIGVSKLDALGRALGFDDAGVAAATSLFELLSEPWADLPLGDRAPWPNDLTDDGTPFELSVAINNRRPELRMLLEPQLLPVGPRSNWEAGLQLHERLARRGLISTERFDRIADLFKPAPGNSAHFSLWTAALLRANARPLIKAYTNPQARGRGAASALVQEALARLQLPEANSFLERTLGTSSPWDVRYFALDLDADAEARVKVYVASSGGSDEVAHLVRGTSNITPEQAEAWLFNLTGRRGPFDQRPVLTCFAFTAGKPVPNATLHVPIRCYVSDDEQAATRIGRLLNAQGKSQLRSALNAVSERPLSAGRGLLTYASLRPDAEELRVTVYLAPETYSIAAPRRAPVRALVRVRPPHRSDPPPTRAKLSSAIDAHANAFLQHEVFSLLETEGVGGLNSFLPKLTLFSLFVRDALFLDRSAAHAYLDTETYQAFEGNTRRLRGLVGRVAAEKSAHWPFDDAHDLARVWAYAKMSELIGIADTVARKAACATLARLLCPLLGAVLQSFDAGPASLAAADGAPSRDPSTDHDAAVSESSHDGAVSAIAWAATTVDVVAKELVGLLHASQLEAESAVFKLNERR